MDRKSIVSSWEDLTLQLEVHLELKSMEDAGLTEVEIQGYLLFYLQNYLDLVEVT